jgi:hypothetical protein
VLIVAPGISPTGSVTTTTATEGYGLHGEIFASLTWVINPSNLVCFYGIRQGSPPWWGCVLAVTGATELPVQLTFDPADSKIQFAARPPPWFVTSHSSLIPVVIILSQPRLGLDADHPGRRPPRAGPPEAAQVHHRKYQADAGLPPLFDLTR